MRVGFGVENAVEPEFAELPARLLEVVLADGEVPTDVGQHVQSGGLDPVVKALTVLAGVPVQRGDQYSLGVVGPCRVDEVGLGSLDAEVDYLEAPSRQRLFEDRDTDDVCVGADDAENDCPGHVLQGRT